MERWQQMRRRNCIMVLVCSRRDTKPWPGFYLRTFTPHHRLFPLCLYLHVRLYSSSPPSSSCFCFSLPYFIPRFLCYSLLIFIFSSFFFFSIFAHSSSLSSSLSFSSVSRPFNVTLFFFLFLIARRLLSFEQ